MNFNSGTSPKIDSTLAFSHYGRAPLPSPDPYKTMSKRVVVRVEDAKHELTLGSHRPPPSGTDLGGSICSMFLLELVY